MRPGDGGNCAQQNSTAALNQSVATRRITVAAVAFSSVERQDVHRRCHLVAEAAGDHACGAGRVAKKKMNTVTNSGGSLPSSESM